MSCVSADEKDGTTHVRFGRDEDAIEYMRMDPRQRLQKTRRRMQTKVDRRDDDHQQVDLLRLCLSMARSEVILHVPFAGITES